MAGSPILIPADELVIVKFDEYLDHRTHEQWLPPPEFL